MQNPEIIELVSADDSEVIGLINRDELYEKKLRNFRVINVLILNQQNQIWIPRRHASKKLFPSCLDCSVGGHVSAGETYLEAFIRETLEEVNINPLDYPYKFLMKLSPYTDAVSAFMHVYTLHCDHEISYNQKDFEDYDWLSPEKILQKIQNGTPAKSDLIKIIQGYIQHEKNNSNTISSS